MRLVRGPYGTYLHTCMRLLSLLTCNRVVFVVMLVAMIVFVGMSWSVPMVSFFTENNQRHLLTDTSEKPPLPHHHYSHRHLRRSVLLRHGQRPRHQLPPRRRQGAA